MTLTKSKTGHVRGDVKLKAIRTVTRVSQSISQSASWDLDHS